MPLRKDYKGFEVKCDTCDRTKQPVGRSAPPGMWLCDPDCPGYYREPLASNLWPGESEADFGYPVSR